MTTALHRPAVAAAGAVLAMAALASCGATPTSDGKNLPPAESSPAESSPEAQPLPSGASGTPRPGLPNPKKVRDNPSAVSKAALTVMWTVDTRIDVSLHDASVRAAAYATPKYARQVRDTPPRSAPGAEWHTWASHEAYTKVKLTPADDAGTPPDTEVKAYRTWTVTTTPHGAKGWTGDPTTVTAFVQLTGKADKGWKVNAVQIQ